MNRSLLIQQLYSSSSGKYLKFKVRLDKARLSGRFYKFNRRKQHSLLARLKRLFERLKSLQAQLRLAGAGAAFALTLSLSNRADAQTLGPFVINDAANPLPPPYVISHPRPAVVDIDNDGDLDVFVGNSTGDIEFYRNTGGATTVRRLAKVTGSSNPFDGVNEGQYAAPAFADVDGDGDFDMLLGTYYGSTFFFRNTGSSTNPIFTEQTGASNPFDGITGTVNKYGIDEAIPVFVDIDKDGDVDLFMGSSNSYDYNGDHPAVKFYRNNAGVFAPTSHPLNGNLQNFSQAAMTFADLDNDTDLDVLVGSSVGQIQCFINVGGVFNQQVGSWNPITRTGNPMNGFYSANVAPTFADFDDDGDLDLLIGEGDFYNNQSVSYFENTDGAYTFKERSDLNISPFGGVDVGAEAVPVFTDLDGDGDIDVIIGAKYSSPDIYVYINENGDFMSHPTHPLVSVLNSLGFSSDIIPVFADIDNDSDQDLFVCRDYNILFFRNSAGTFVNESTLFPSLNGTIARELSLAFIDVDNDGDMDALLGNDRSGQPKVLYFQNTGTAESPTFLAATPPVPFNTLSFTLPNPNLNLTSIDLDHDGDSDLSLTETFIGTSARVRFFENNRDGTFTEKTNSILAQNVPALSFTSFADNDGDGDLDAFVGIGSSLKNGEITYFENTNPPPVTSVSTTTLAVNGGSAILLVPTLLLTDTDNDEIPQAVISIENFRVGEEVLTFTAQAGIIGSFNTATGVLTLSGLASVATYQSALRTIAYQFTGSKPNQSGRKAAGARTITLNRTFSFLVNDVDLTTTLIAQLAAQITFPNSNPTLAGATPTIIFNAAPVVIGSSLVPSDGDDTDLEGATIAITTGLVIAEDRLVFASQNGITGNYNPATGILALTGLSSVSNYQTALRSVQYNNIASIPNTQNRSVSFSVTDGEATSNLLSVNISITPVSINNPPVINAPTQTTQIGSIITVNLTPLVSDPDNNIDLSSLKIISPPTSGASASINASSELILDYSSTDFAGTDQLTIEICDLLNACTQAIITVNVEGDVIVYNGFSPNGDSKNPFFRIANIKMLEPQNKVSIFNRWGDLVYEEDNYDNNTRKFDGRNKNGNELPSGTYFYRIQFTGTNKREPMTGFLTIKK